MVGTPVAEGAGDASVKAGNGTGTGAADGSGRRQREGRILDEFEAVGVPPERGNRTVRRRVVAAVARKTDDAVRCLTLQRGK